MWPRFSLYLHPESHRDKPVMQIIPLTQRPDVLPQVARWIYDAFWQASDFDVTHVEKRLKTHLTDEAMPATFLATVETRVVGTVSFVESDLSERPTLSPWLAALYVLPDYRQQGIGEALVNALLHHAQQAEYAEVYLCADDKVAFYQKRGWHITERNVGDHRLTVMRMTLNSQP
jgi:predicted N-acetyltransferase YhbS